VPSIALAWSIAATEESGSVPVEAVWVGAVGVILAAVITSGALYIQTRRSLRAEEKRLALQLAHDRATREREEFRRLVDDAAAHLDLLTMSVIEAMTSVELLDDERAGPVTETVSVNSHDTPSNRSADYSEKLERVFSDIREIDGLKARLSVRLGPDHEAVQKFVAARTCYGRIYEQLINGDVPPVEEQKQAFAEIGVYERGFLLACYRLIGSELEDSTVGRRGS
jgi:hypothetical protein